jgi:hypothetical protein
VSKITEILESEATWACIHGVGTGGVMTQPRLVSMVGLLRSSAVVGNYAHT